MPADPTAPSEAVDPNEVAEFVDELIEHASPELVVALARKAMKRVRELSEELDATRRASDARVEVERASWKQNARALECANERLNAKVEEAWNDLAKVQAEADARVAAAVREEREACATMCEMGAQTMANSGSRAGASRCAEVIRRNMLSPKHSDALAAAEKKAREDGYRQGLKDGLAAKPLDFNDSRGLREAADGR